MILPFEPGAFPWQTSTDYTLATGQESQQCDSHSIQDEQAPVARYSGSLVGGDGNMDFIFPFSWECHHPN